ncbi:hypothetical protein HDV06_000178 [Boothiomyces sp. JEL0866]|nr:hypothetical protein HDV06_000178 [Boothiomyces sp. JEL0866]
MGLTADRIKELQDHFGQSRPTLIRSYSNKTIPKVENVNKDECSLCLANFSIDHPENSYQLNCCGNRLHRDCYSVYRLNKFEQCLLCRAMLPEFEKEELYKRFDLEDETLEIVQDASQVRFSIEAEGQVQKGELDCLIKLSAVKSEEINQGLDLVLLVDVSGSMANIKLEMVKDSIVYLISHQLNEKDRLAIVTFNEHAKVICNFTRITNEIKNELIGIVNGSLFADGGTSMREGIKMGLEMLECRSVVNSNSAMLLFSDGEDSKPDDKYKVFKYLETAKQKCLPIQCFGYGETHDYKYLSDIALGSSNGSYLYIESPEDISSSLVGAVGGISSVVAKDLSVLFDFGTLELIEMHCGSYPVELDQNSAKVTLKNLYSKELRNIKCKFQVAEILHTPVTGQLIASFPSFVPFEFTIAISDFSNSLQKQNAEDYLRDELSKSIRLAEDGNYFLAKKTLQAASDVLSRTRKDLLSEHPNAKLEYYDYLLQDIEQLQLSFEPQLFEKVGKFLVSHVHSELSQQRTLRLQSKEDELLDELLEPYEPKAPDLIDLLLSHGIFALMSDMELTQMMLILYPLYVRPSDLMDILLDKFDTVKNLNNNALKIRFVVCNDRLCNFVLVWADLYWSDFDDKMRYTLKFLSKRIALDESFLDISERMKEKSKKPLELCEYDFGFLDRTSNEPAAATKHEIVGGKINWIAEIDSDIIAKQLTLYEWDIFIAINPRDFLQHQRGKSKPNTALAKAIQHFNFISSLVKTLILVQETLEARTQVLLKFIKIAKNLRTTNNFNTLMAVMGGLNHSSITRLHKTHEAARSYSLYEDFISLQRLVTGNNGYFAYRQALNISNLPCIPYIGLFSRDISRTSEFKDRNPNLTESIDITNGISMGDTLVRFENTQLITNILSSLTMSDEVTAADYLDGTETIKAFRT